MAAVRGQALAWPDFQVGRFSPRAWLPPISREKELVGSFLKAQFGNCIMKQTDSDRPEKLKPTAEKPFCNCEASHPPLFAIRPGIDAADAWVHACLLARGLNQIASDYAQHHAPERSRDIVWSMQHSAESLSAILDGLLDGQEA